MRLIICILSFLSWFCSFSQRASERSAELNVKNRGLRDGDEAAPLYVKNLSSKNPPPNKSLKGFKRISRKKGESKTVAFLIRARDVKYFDEPQDDYATEACLYEIQAGASSEDLRLRGTFDIK